MKNDHVEGYCITKVLVQSSPVLHTANSEIRPLAATAFGGHGNGNSRQAQVPKDFYEIMGEKLPHSLYYLMVQGVISHKIPQAFARGEWVDKTQPLVDTEQFRDLSGNLVEYRERAINIIARNLNKTLAT